MGFVVKVRRISDKKVLICKIVDLGKLDEGVKTEWRKAVKDEVSVMMLNGGESIVGCYDSFDH